MAYYGMRQHDETVIPKSKFQFLVFEVYEVVNVGLP